MTNKTQTFKELIDSNERYSYFYDKGLLKYNDINELLIEIGYMIDDDRYNPDDDYEDIAELLDLNVSKRHLLSLYEKALYFIYINSID